uniref:(California timema) hypothetical protein n=1 Tax=Timema californicum TaxID=61474 RepID=A0A7R9J997_TIMCA|nr:unnamed protein product [Timema californicum]
MNRWKGRVALVTGASAGIGEAIAKALVKQGMKVVGLARSFDRMKNYEKELEGEPGKFYPIKADMTKEEDLLAAFKWVSENLDGVDVLVNNAGVAFEARLLALATIAMLVGDGLEEEREDIGLGNRGVGLEEEVGRNEGTVARFNPLVVVSKMLGA